MRFVPSFVDREGWVTADDEAGFRLREIIVMLGLRNLGEGWLEENEVRKVVDRKMMLSKVAGGGARGRAYLSEKTEDRRFFNLAEIA